MDVSSRPGTPLVWARYLARIEALLVREVPEGSVEALVPRVDLLLLAEALDHLLRNVIRSDREDGRRHGVGEPFRRSSCRRRRSDPCRRARRPATASRARSTARETRRLSPRFATERTAAPSRTMDVERALGEGRAALSGSRVDGEDEGGSS